MVDLIIRTSLPQIQTEVILDTQELKITIGQATIFVQYEKNVEIQTNQDLKGHWIDFIMGTYDIVNSSYNESKDVKIIRTGKLKFRLENVKKLNPNFKDFLPTEDKNGIHYIV